MVALTAHFVTKFGPETPCPAPAELLCCVCGSARIPAPDGATAETRFTCRDCSRRIWRRKQTARAKLPVDLEVAGGSRIPF